MESINRYMAIIIIMLLMVFKMVNKVNASMLNVTCDNERNNIIAGQSGSIILLKCCSEYFMCKCLQQHCRLDMNNDADVWCKFIRKNPCRIQPKCYDKHVVTIDNNGNSPECEAFKSNWRQWLLTIIIYGSTIVATGIIVLICLVGYKKCKAIYKIKYSEKKRKRQQPQRTELRFTLATTPNVDSVFVVDKLSRVQSGSRSFSAGTGGISKTVSGNQRIVQNQNEPSISDKVMNNNMTTTTTTGGERQPYSISYSRNTITKKNNRVTKCGRNRTENKKITRSFLVKALM